MNISYILRQIVESIMFVGGSFIEPADIAVSSSVVRIPCGRKRETDTEPAILNCSKLFSTNSIKICCQHQLNINCNLRCIFGIARIIFILFHTYYFIVMVRKDAGNNQLQLTASSND